MTGYNSFDFNNSAFLKAIEHVRRTIDAVNVPMDGMHSRKANALLLFSLFLKFYALLVNR